MTEFPIYVHLVWSANMTHLVAVCATADAAETVRSDMLRDFPDAGGYHIEQRGLVK